MRSTQLPVPVAVRIDPHAVELLRVWAAQGKQHVSLATGIWEDPANWGIMLVDLAKHVALAIQQSTGGEFDDILQRIHQGFVAEWENETDKPTGKILE